MSINIMATNLTIDESLVNDNNDITALPAPISTALTNLSLNTTSDTGFPQYAYKDGFVSVQAMDGESITGLTFRQLVNGEYVTFSKTIGVETDFHLTGSTDTIYLFATDDPNVIVGRVGGPTGDVAFAIVLQVEMTGSQVTGADAYIVQYASLDHPTGGDSHDEEIDLSGLVYVAALGRRR